MAETQVLEKTDAAIAQIAEQITGLVGAHGLEAVELAGLVYQLTAAGSLLAPLVLIVLTTIGVIGVVRLARATYRTAVADSNDPRVLAYGAPALMLGIGTLASGIATLKYTVSGLTSPLVWASAFDPEIALAVHILSRL